MALSHPIQLTVVRVKVPTSAGELNPPGKALSFPEFGFKPAYSVAEHLTVRVGHVTA